MRGKKVKELRRKVKRKWETIDEEKRADFKSVFRFVKKRFTQGFIKEDK